MHIDVSRFANVTHFLQHSDTPNVVVVNVVANSNVPHVALFAARRISAFEEITCDLKKSTYQEDLEELSAAARSPSNML